LSSFCNSFGNSLSMGMLHVAFLLNASATTLAFTSA
jgi:hypothetical protein